MYLERVRIVQFGPLEEFELELFEHDQHPRLLTVIHGRGGIGKTTILEAIANTRPGKAMPLSPHRRRDPDDAHAVCEWRLFDEDETRPHPLVVASPNVRLAGDGESARRREQSHFDRCAVQGPGYVFVDIPSHRSFSRASLGLTDPGRSMSRYDVRGQTAGYDASRPDLTRPCKQAISYAAIRSALVERVSPARGFAYSSPDGLSSELFDPLGHAMHAAIGELAKLAGYWYRGLDIDSLEPMFEAFTGERLSFDALPTQLRHALSFVALPLRAAWAGHAGADPRTVECVVTIDDFELFLGPNMLQGLFPALRRAMPKAQWLLTTSSPYAAAYAAADALYTLRREPDNHAVAVYHGQSAFTH